MEPSDFLPVSVTRTIEASAEDVFAILADPARHPGIDGSGMVRRALSHSPVVGIGDAFVMKMHNAEMGDYEITNYVVVFEANRRIGWEPVLSAASRAEDQVDIDDRSEHRWSYELLPIGPSSTIVTEVYDCTRAPEWLRKAVRNGNRWLESMAATLEKLAEQSQDRGSTTSIGAA